jgi:hypothetical protein
MGKTLDMPAAKVTDRQSRHSACPGLARVALGEGAKGYTEYPSPNQERGEARTPRVDER